MTSVLSLAIGVGWKFEVLLMRVFDLRRDGRPKTAMSHEIMIKMADNAKKMPPFHGSLPLSDANFRFIFKLEVSRLSALSIIF